MYVSHGLNYNEYLCLHLAAHFDVYNIPRMRICYKLSSSFINTCSLRNLRYYVFQKKAEIRRLI